MSKILLILNVVLAIIKEIPALIKIIARIIDAIKNRASDKIRQTVNALRNDKTNT